MNVWIFQAFPTLYDLRDEVPKGIKRGDWWRVTRFRKEIRKGDAILFWQAGVEAGIYATGKVLTDPHKKRAGWRVDVKYHPLLDFPIFKTRLRIHPGLKGLSIIKQPRGTNFRVRPEEWKALATLLESTEISLSKSSEDPFDASDTKDERQRVEAEIGRRQGQTEFRRRLFRRYGCKCMVSGYDCPEAVEAAHVSGYKGEKSNHPSNGLLLRSDIHTLFDLHLICVCADGQTIRIAPALRKTQYRRLHGQKLRFQNEGARRPSHEALAQHRRDFLIKQKRDWS